MAVVAACLGFRSHYSPSLVYLSMTIARDSSEQKRTRRQVRTDGSRHSVEKNLFAVLY